jgi:hypothetical protein
MEQQHEHCVLQDDEEMEWLSKSKLLFPRQSLLFKLDPTKALSVGDLCRVIASDSQEYCKLIHSAYKEHESSRLSDIMSR